MKDRARRKHDRKRRRQVLVYISYEKTDEKEGEKQEIENDVKKVDDSIMEKMVRRVSKPLRKKLSIIFICHTIWERRRTRRGRKHGGAKEMIRIG
jgi:hypothetical protein